MNTDHFNFCAISNFVRSLRRGVGYPTEGPRGAFLQKGPGACWQQGGGCIALSVWEGLGGGGGLAGSLI